MNGAANPWGGWASWHYQHSINGWRTVSAAQPAALCAPQWEAANDGTHAFRIEAADIRSELCNADGLEGWGRKRITGGVYLPADWPMDDPDEILLMGLHVPDVLDPGDTVNNGNIYAAITRGQMIWAVRGSLAKPALRSQVVATELTRFRLPLQSWIDWELVIDMNPGQLGRVRGNIGDVLIDVRDVPTSYNQTRPPYPQQGMYCWQVAKRAYSMRQRGLQITTL